MILQLYHTSPSLHILKSCPRLSCHLPSIFCSTAWRRTYLLHIPKILPPSRQTGQVAKNATKRRGSPSAPCCVLFVFLFWRIVNEENDVSSRMELRSKHDRFKIKDKSKLFLFTHLQGLLLFSLFIPFTDKSKSIIIQAFFTHIIPQARFYSFWTFPINHAVFFITVFVIRFTGRPVRV